MPPPITTSASPPPPALLPHLPPPPAAASTVPTAPVAATSMGLTAGGGGKTVAALLDQYQRARLAFAQGIADCAAREAPLEHLAAPAARAAVVPLLRPLLLDQVVAVQQAAALALGRLANHSPQLAAHVVAGDVLPHIVYSLDSPNRFYKKSAAFVLRAVARHSPELAHRVVEAHAVDALCACLQDFDAGVKESAAWALGYIAKHTMDLAHAIVDAGAVPLLVMCLQEPEVSLRRISASALSDLAKHSAQLAQAVVDAGAVAPLVALLASTDAKLKRQAICALAQIARHSVDLAEAVVDGDLFPRVLVGFKDMDGGVRRQTAVLLCEVAKHSPDLAQLLVNSGAVAALIDFLGESRGVTARLPAVMALGYIAAFSETLALAVLVAKGVPPLMDVLATESEPAVKAACAWTLGQIGRHSPDHAKALAAHAVLPKLLALLTQPAAASTTRAASPGTSTSPARTSSNKKPTSASPRGDDGTNASYEADSPSTTTNSTSDADVRVKAKRAVKAILEKTLQLDALAPLVHLATPPNILKHVLAQLARILPTDVGARRKFVTSGCCQRVQEIAAAYSSSAGRDGEPFAASKMAESVRQINACFPEEIVRYYSPGYSAVLLQKLDEYAAGGNAQHQGVGGGARSIAPSESAGNAAVAGSTVGAGSQGGLASAGGARPGSGSAAVPVDKVEVEKVGPGTRGTTPGSAAAQARGGSGTARSAAT
ncbi:Sperm-associated antigen 6 [Allomyces arbusculus]|nr:Sperm-associated antigen 6 [Allomyces arbusculus]